MTFLWALIGLLCALHNIYVGYLFLRAALGPKLSQKGIALQAAPFLGGLGLAVVALPLIWNCIRLATAKPPSY